MDRCPIEILFLIFSHACTDDGFTGLSLSLVSKHIRKTSRLHALQSVALYGTDQVVAFSNHLESLEPKSRRVQHLFLTDRQRVWMEYPKDQDRIQWYQDRLREDFRIAPVREYPGAPLLRLLALAAPTLSTLALLLFDRYDAHPLSVPLPALRELTLHASSLHSVHAPPAAVALGDPSPGPSSAHAAAECTGLRRLHIVQDKSAIRHSVPRAVAHLAPRLTHLRLSRVTGAWLPQDEIVAGLERLLGADGDLGIGTGGFPPTLQRVVLQMLEYEQPRLLDTRGRIVGCVRVLPQPSRFPMAGQLKDLAMRDVRRRIVLVKPLLRKSPDNIFAEGRDTDVAYYIGLKASWEDRVVGKEVVWEVPYSEVLASYRFSPTAAGGPSREL